MRFLYFLIILSVLFAFASSSEASVILLQSGEKIDGQILQRTPLQVMVEAQGNIETFYLAEILSIDGKEVIAPHERLTLAKQEDSLTAVMKQRHAMSRITSPKPARQPSVLPAPKKIDVRLNDMHVVPTSDGGIIVVTPTKITKYNKDLKVIKEIHCIN